MISLDNPHLKCHIDLFLFVMINIHVYNMHIFFYFLNFFLKKCLWRFILKNYSNFFTVLIIYNFNLNTPCMRLLNWRSITKASLTNHL